ncbi:MAG: creatininase family protein [Anaerolineae bacterium]
MPAAPGTICELETSMILRLRPELVRLDLARGANVDIGSAFYCPDTSRASRVLIAKPFEHIARSGALGHPEIATAEKGEAIFEVAVKEIVALVREIAQWQALEPG